MRDVYDPRPLFIQSPPFDLAEAEMYDMGLVLCLKCRTWVAKEAACDDKFFCEFYWIGMEDHFTY